MKKLNDRQFEWWLKRVRDMAKEEHQEHNVQILLADLYFTLCDGFVWQILKIKWREWKIKRAVLKHKKCCPALLEDY